MRAFDQARQIGEHEIAFVDAHHAELRRERGERIIRDLGARARYARKKCGFARVRQTDEARIGDQLESKDDRLFFAGLAGIGVARRLIGRAFEMRIAEAAIAAFQQQQALRRCVARSAISVSPSSSKICVPTGTRITASSPPAPVISLPMPPSPFLARTCC